MVRCFRKGVKYLELCATPARLLSFRIRRKTETLQALPLLADRTWPALSTRSSPQHSSPRHFAIPLGYTHCSEWSIFTKKATLHRLVISYFFSIPVPTGSNAKLHADSTASYLTSFCTGCVPCLAGRNNYSTTRPGHQQSPEPG